MPPRGNRTRRLRENENSSSSRADFWRFRAERSCSGRSAHWCTTPTHCHARLYWITLMSIDVSSIQTFTNAELAIIFRKAAVDAAFAQSMTVNGRNLSRVSPKELLALADACDAAS